MMRAPGQLKTSEPLRKLLHALFSLALLVPLTHEYGAALRGLGLRGDAALSTYFLLLFVALFISTLRVRRPELGDVLFGTMREARRSVLQHVKSLVPLYDVVEGVEQALDRVEQGFARFLEAVERDYERQYGYLAAVCGVASIAASYGLFGADATARGILALAIVDPTSSLITMKLGSGCRILKHSAYAPLASALALAVALCALGDRPWGALLLGAVAALLELASPEDNLTLPLGVAATHCLLRLGE